MGSTDPTAAALFASGESLPAVQAGGSAAVSLETLGVAVADVREARLLTVARRSPPVSGAPPPL